MAKDNNNNEEVKSTGAPVEASQDKTPEFTSTNVSNMDPDSEPIGPGSPNTKTNPRKASIIVAEPTQIASNQTQFKLGKYRKGNKLFNANGKEIDESGSVIE